MSAVRIQQFRWTKGAAETGRKNLRPLWQSSQPIETKILGTFHMLNSFVFPALLFLALSMVLLEFFGGPGAIGLLVLYNVILGTIATLVVYTYVVAHTKGRLDSSNIGTFKAIYTSVLFFLIVFGLTRHNSVAVAQGLFGQTTPFIRTPKPQSRNPDSTSSNTTPQYRQHFQPIPIILEIALGCMFAWSAWHSIGTVYSFSILSNVFFSVGYFMIVVLSLREVFFEKQ
jgi:hypothetical protein